MPEEPDMFGSMRATVTFLFLGDALVREGNTEEYGA